MINAMLAFLWPPHANKRFLLPPITDAQSRSQLLRDGYHAPRHRRAGQKLTALRAMSSSLS